MKLRDAVMVADLCAAVNRLLLHGDVEELRLLTDEQFSLYLSGSGLDEEGKSIITALAGRGATSQHNTTAERRPGRPAQSEVAKRLPPQETEVTVHNVPNRQMVLSLMVCCGRWERPQKLKDLPEYSLVRCPGCGKQLHLYPSRQQVL